MICFFEVMIDLLFDSVTKFSINSYYFLILILILNTQVGFQLVVIGVFVIENIESLSSLYKFQYHLVNIF